MIVACHQPNYLPWSGFFYKMMSCDAFVIMDSCQFPRGGSFVNRNRVKTPPSNFLWLTVPVIKKGKGLQPINRVRIDNAVGWSIRHLESLIHFYKRAPYFDDHIEFFRYMYRKRWDSLVTLNIEIINFFKKLLKIETKIHYLSKLKIEGKGTSLLVNISKIMGADIYLSGYGGRKYINERLFKEEGLEVRYYNFRSPIYPQLWGEFLYNLSIIDLVFNCGEKAGEIIKRFNESL